ncbi:uncharacterized protein LOC141691875 [Apium graveolens]|uniref:uncharacterized protein LOC141691875 n=1 Tax=Apium graveolens TaxID=4045 RepID=UPI003D79FBDB
MSSYAKFMKGILSRKLKLEELKIVALTEECSALLQQKLPPKLKDPGSFTIQYTIGELSFDKCLCDLGARINLMSLSVSRKLGLPDPKPTNMSLQLADRSITYPRECLAVFKSLKKSLTTIPVITALDWDEPFEMMCDASDFAVRDVLGQNKKNIFRVVYYASKTLHGA